MRKGGASAAAAAAAAAAGGASASKDDGDDQISRDEDRSPSGAPLEEPAMQVIVLVSKSHISLRFDVTIQVRHVSLW